MFRIYPYKTGSASARLLKQGLNALSIKLQGSRYRSRANHIVINWGNSTTPDWLTNTTHILNKPESVAIATSKWDTLVNLNYAGLSVPKYSHLKNHAYYWIDEGYTVFARTKLSGHSGDGIVVCRTKDEVPDAPMYTRAIQNNGEYRVHVFNGDIILYQKKSRRVDENGDVLTPTNSESLVRNLSSGWVYRTGNLRRLERIETLAKETLEVLGLDFGAVDIIKDNNGDVYVLEVNTAPGLGNTQTLDAYINAFSNYREELAEQYALTV